MHTDRRPAAVPFQPSRFLWMPVIPVWHGGMPVA